MAQEVIIASGRGGRVWDVSGNEYVDYLLGSGPMLVGHAHPEVVAAVEEQVRKGTTFTPQLVSKSGYCCSNLAAMVFISLCACARVIPGFSLATARANRPCRSRS